MKSKLSFTLLCIFLGGTLFGQLKHVDFKNETNKTGTLSIVPPQSKVLNENQADSRIPYAPKSLTFERDKANGLKVYQRDIKSGIPLFISGSPEIQSRNVGTAQNRAFNFLENAKGLMKIISPENEFLVQDEEVDILGMTHIKMQQQYKGIPVFGAEVIYHEGGETPFVNGRFFPSPQELNDIAAISEMAAEKLVKEDVGDVKPLPKDKYKIFDIEQSVSKLVFYPINERDVRLAYHTVVYKDLVNRWEYFTDANSGEIIDKYKSICQFHNIENTSKCDHTHSPSKLSPIHKEESKYSFVDGAEVVNAQDLFGNFNSIDVYEVGGTYFLLDAAKPMYDAINSSMPNDPVGAVWTIDAFNTSPQNNDFVYDHVTSGNGSFSGEQTGVTAHINGGKAYQYFKNIHARESINGDGGNVIGLINIADEDGGSLGNAFWNGIAMFYGNGDSNFRPLARGLDVAGHEMSHGVVQSTANLTYNGESGALNESFADIFGAMIDRDDWLIGEDVVRTSAFPSGALRSLEDPHNGAATNDFNSGYQPRTYSERFTGPEDNNGVHINSGIPNWAFYKFATSNGVGKNNAEDVFYRALTRYMTASSQFIDARLATIQAAEDLRNNGQFGQNVVDALAEAWDDVEVFDGNGTNNQTDVEVNPGSDLILFTTEDQNNLYIADAAGNLLFNPLTSQDPISVPSITDDGTEIVFVNSDNDLYYIRLDWVNGEIVEEGVLTSNNKWRNAVFSRDGLRLAALPDQQDNTVFVFDFETNSSNTYELFNPTFTEGVATGDVLYADAMEFDFTGEYLMYDAFNRLESTFGNNIDYWDIGFIKVYNNDSNTFTLGSEIQKLFSQLPEGISVGNPTFAKNSDYIIAFDFVEDGEFSVLGANAETGEVQEIFDNNSVPGYPSYALSDDRIIFDAEDNTSRKIIAVTELLDNKIEAEPNTAQIFLGFDDTGVKWGVWFGNGDRVISNVEDLALSSALEMFPNPTGQYLNWKLSEETDELELIITDLLGKVYIQKSILMSELQGQVDVSGLNNGQYIFTLKSNAGSTSRMFMKSE